MIIKKFQEQVEAFPANIAIKVGNRAITYSELNSYANRVASAVIAGDKEAGGDNGKQRVSLLFEHGADMIIGVLGALKAGRTYVPMDVTYPQNRLLYMLEDSDSGVILTNNRNLEAAENLMAGFSKKISILNIDGIVDRETKPTISIDIKNNNPLEEEEPAYILYTSGSTGRPKGVVQTSRNVWYYTRHWIERFSITGSDRMTLLSAFSHDGSVMDMFPALLAGAALYPYNIKSGTGTAELYALLVEEKITVWHSVPSLFRYFAGTLTERDYFYHIRWVLLGGEPLREHDLTLFSTYFPKSTLGNIYGQTESSVAATCAISPGSTFDDVSIGKPLDETEILVVDDDGDIVEKIGVGEIVLASDYVALGYWNDREHTEQVFTRDDEMGRLYWTGDLGRLSADRTIKMVGRKDFQIKIRGYRVETGEIETRLLQHEAVTEAAAAAKEDKNGDNYLCAYIVTNKTVSSEELRKYLSEELPDYMVPRYIIPLEEMPVTPNGKIDRKCLPEPEKMIDLESKYEPPGSETEKKVAAIWQEILGVEKVGINDNFIELGGHSLLILAIISKVHQVFNVELQLTDLFDHPTVKELSRLIMASEVTLYSSLEPAEEKDYYLASPDQVRIFILSQLEGIGATYNLPAIMEVGGNFDMRKLESTIKAMINRHRSLRTSFEMIGGDPVQRILRPGHVEFAFECYDTPGADVNERDIIRNFIRPFDLSRAPLLRVGLLETGPDRHIFMLDLHHITADGLSIEVFIKEFRALYAGEILPPLKLQYKDYSEWRNSERQRNVIAEQGAHWFKVFSHEVPVLELPYDFPRPEVQRFEGYSLDFEIGPQETAALKRIARAEGVTLYMLLLALLNVWLSKLSQQEDIVIGTPTVGRSHPDLNRMVGMFVNTLALRMFPVGTKTFYEFLNQVRVNTLEAFENQDYHFGDILANISIQREPSRNPLFDVMFIMQNFERQTEHIPSVELEGLSIKSYGIEQQTSMFDLNIGGFEAGDCIRLVLEYSTNLFKKETAHRFIIYLKTIVSILAKNPGIKLSGIDIISEEEKYQVLYEFNDTAVDYFKSKTIHQLVEEQAEKTPDAVAVVAQGAGTERRFIVSISSKELNKKSLQLARQLRNMGARPGKIVALMTHRDIEMLVGLLAILKSGAAYLPIGPEYPGKRVSAVLRHTNAEILLAGEGITSRESLEHSAQVIELPMGIISNSAAAAGGDWPGAGPAANLAYVIYTSGSTGTPKGVMIEHRAVVNFIKGITDIIPFRENDGILSLTTVAFDIFGLETILPLTKGSRVVMGTMEEQLNASAAAAVIEKEHITILQVTPSRLHVLISHKEGANSLALLKYLLVGGEAFPQPLLEKTGTVTKGKIYNMYGPTETTIWSAVKDVTGEQVLNIGKPIANTRIYIVSQAGHLQPVGIPGELLIGGDGVARGYLNNPALTAERFLKGTGKIFSTPGRRRHTLYKTGDRACWLADGNIEFLGRMDHQVKIRGFRIELEEIETHLQNHDKIKEAVVFTTGEAENKHLCAYIVSHGELNASELREYLSRRLPDYMVPSQFVQMEEIPLSPSGKIDRKALLKHEGRRLRAGAAYVAPASEIEITIANVWKEVLKLDKMGIHDNFFDLGGNSLNIIQLNNRLKEILKRDIPVALMFRYLTISSFARYLLEAKSGAGESKRKAEMSEALNRSKKIYETNIKLFRVRSDK